MGPMMRGSTQIRTTRIIALGGARIERMLVEVLTFEGCPHAAGALMLARHVAVQTGTAVEVRRVNLADNETSSRRFLGSPSIRVDGRDVEPDADARRDYAYACRLYATPAGLQPLPSEAWVRNALLERNALRQSKLDAVARVKLVLTHAAVVVGDADHGRRTSGDRSTEAPRRGRLNEH
jgi:hypothetical protein